MVVNGAGAGTDGNERTWRLRKMCIQRGYKLIWFTLLWLWAKLCFSQYLLPDTIWLQTETGRCMSYEANSTSFCVWHLPNPLAEGGGAQSNGTHISQGGRRGKHWYSNKWVSFWQIVRLVRRLHCAFVCLAICFLSLRSRGQTGSNGQSATGNRQLERANSSFIKFLQRLRLCLVQTGKTKEGNKNHLTKSNNNKN